LKFCIIEEWKN